MAQMRTVAAEEGSSGAGAQERFAALLEEHAGILHKTTRTHARTEPEGPGAGDRGAALAVWVSRRYADRLRAHPFLRERLRDLAGRNLAEAERLAAAAEGFQRDDE